MGVERLKIIRRFERVAAVHWAMLDSMIASVFSIDHFALSHSLAGIKQHSTRVFTLHEMFLRLRLRDVVHNWVHRTDHVEWRLWIYPLSSWLSLLPFSALLEYSVYFSCTSAFPCQCLGFLSKGDHRYFFVRLKNTSLFGVLLVAVSQPRRSLPRTSPACSIVWVCYAICGTIKPAILAWTPRTNLEWRDGQQSKTRLSRVRESKRYGPLQDYTFRTVCSLYRGTRATSWARQQDYDTECSLAAQGGNIDLSKRKTTPRLSVFVVVHSH